MKTKNSIIERVPKDVAKQLKMKWPECSSTERWRRVFDFSAVKVDDWLGKPIKIKKGGKKKIDKFL